MNGKTGLVHTGRVQAKTIFFPYALPGAYNLIKKVGDWATTQLALTKSPRSPAHAKKTALRPQIRISLL